MDDFEAPSFSLGLEEAHELNPVGSFGETALNVPESNLCSENQHVSNVLGSVNGNAGSTGADPDVELPPQSTARILKRLKRGPSQAYSGSSVVQQEEKSAQNASETKRNALQSFWKSLNDQKASSSRGVVAGEDDIEEYSSDDDFQPQEFCSHSARKLSLIGSASSSGSAAMQRASIGFVQRDNSIFQGQTAQGKNSARFCDVQERLNGIGRMIDKPNNFRGNSDDTLPKPIVRSEITTLRNGDFQTKQSSNQHTSPAKQFEEIEISQVEYKTNDSRLNALLRQRFPHFVPVNALSDGEQTSSERVYIDYVNQFAAGGNASAPSESTILRKDSKWTRAATRTTTKRTQAARKKRKTVVVDNDGWVQPSRPPVFTQRTGGQSGTGRWVTEKSGKRIYITRDGTKLSGKSAYKQHCKEKRFTKTKRGRPRNKK